MLLEIRKIGKKKKVNKNKRLLFCFRFDYCCVWF